MACVAVGLLWSMMRSYKQHLKNLFLSSSFDTPKRLKGQGQTIGRSWPKSNYWKVIVDDFIILRYLCELRTWKVFQANLGLHPGFTTNICSNCYIHGLILHFIKPNSGLPLFLSHEIPGLFPDFFLVFINKF